MKFLLDDELLGVGVSKSGKTARQKRTSQAAYYFTFASAVSILFSIALSQLLLGLAIVSLLISRKYPRFPPVKLPLALFMALTVLADLLSRDPAAGLPQVRKFYVFAMLPMVFTTFTAVNQIRSLVLSWAAVASLSASWSFVQFAHRYKQALEQYAYNYGFFLDGRITGFASHWMTFGAEEMIVLLMFLSFLFFAPAGRIKLLGLVFVPVLWVSIVLGLTRSIFLLGLPLGVLYLLWNWKHWIVAFVPAVILIELLFAPVQVRERVSSVVQPHQGVDSNTHRTITRRTGMEMIKKHPFFGLGPEQVGPQFLRYLPADIPRPLPKGYYGHLHNTYLQYAAERGIPALLMMLWLIGKMLVDFHRGLKTGALAQDASFVLYGAIATTLGLLMEGFFEYNLGDSEVLTLFLTIVACAYVSLGARNSPHTIDMDTRLKLRRFTEVLQNDNHLTQPNP